ncbi:MAG TPA: hypothetical protein VFG66_17505 [Gemmatimonadales bacterium]|jgi:hypothetical protein|nr:hypothetical protein [Gemmatimonadales bacterium]
MSPRKPTIDDTDDVDDEDGELVEDVNRETDLTLRPEDADDVGLGGDDETAEQEELGGAEER